MSSADESPLSIFDPVVADWFGRKIGRATEVQGRAWPVIASGRHLLVTAPTGSGKTLAAFLWPLNQLLMGAWEGGRLRVLYISPLKALNNDIQRNLLGPLAEIDAEFATAAKPAAPVRVATRSGDTPTRERQAILRHPPEILITTPESLNLLLTSPRGRLLFGGLKTVILDEIHAVAASKRGIHLATAVERLVPLAGEFQRVALSATVRPAERIARFVGGLELVGDDAEPGYRPRKVEIVRGSAAKRYEIEVCRPREVVEAVAASEDPDGPPASLWDALTTEFGRRIRANRSTLVFANNRRTTEKLTRLLNESEGQGFVYSHHGSLSREIRSIVEERLKRGELRALVATNSLELGIDIGSLDEVLLVKTPPSIASAVQRIGRSGHRVGETSRGRFYPLFGRDLVEAAVVAKAVEEHDLEELQPIEGALDVLAQVVLSITANETWRIDELFDQIRTSFSYRNLSRRQFDLVIEMLTGRYANGRVRELQPRLAFDRVDGTVRGRAGTARLVYLSGGTIPDRGYFHLRLQETMAKLGELDEEFVWERSVGDTFSLGAQAWRIRQITHNDVLVTPIHRSAAMAPFWRAEERDRSFHLSARAGEFLEEAEKLLAGRRGAEKLRQRLEMNHRMSPPAAAALIDLLERQRSATGSPLPHRHHLLVERTAAPGLEPGRSQVTLHTGWGGTVNRPLAIALAAAWEARYGVPLEIEHDNDCLLLSVVGDLETSEVLELVRPDNIEKLLEQRLATTGFFGARFRESAGCALLLPRSGVKRRIPLWLQRERGKKLLGAVSRHRDFPMVVETWRTCLQDAFEIEALKRLLNEVADGTIALSEVTTDVASPFSADLRWKQTNRLMYEDDTPESGSAGAVKGELLREIVFSSRLRPRLPASLVEEFESKLQRRFSGYAPRTATELVEWVKERVLIPEDEWRDLIAAIDRDADARQASATEAVEAALEKLVWIETEGRSLVALEQIPRIAMALDRRPEELGLESTTQVEALFARQSETPGEDALEQLVAEWVRFYGPFEVSRLERAFGLEPARATEIVESLVDSEQVVIDSFRADDAPVEVCDAENLERLLRLLRARARPSFEAWPLDRLPLFLASYQGLSRRPGTSEDLKRSLEQLLLWPVSVRLWEAEILPARLEPYFPEWLDSLMLESDLMWLGCGREKVCFLFSADLGLRGRAGQVDADGVSDELLRLFPDERGRYGLAELAGGGASSAELSQALWQWAWDGRVSNTTFLAVRKGALSRFEAAAEDVTAKGATRSGPARRGRRGRFDRWQSSRPFSGDWYRVPASEEEADALEEEELNKERVRILLDRYGVLFRELLARELPAFRWGALFRSLRLMELSGEVVAGYFFSDIPGPQFASRGAFRQLEEGIPEDSIFWLNAVDPASPCGLGLEAWKGRFPARKPSNHLVFHGARLVLVSRRNGSSLTIHVDPEHPELRRYLEFLKVRLGRRFEPAKAVDVETINGKPAATSPYAEPIRQLFSATREGSSLRLRRRY